MIKMFVLIFCIVALLINIRCLWTSVIYFIATEKIFKYINYLIDNNDFSVRYHDYYNEYLIEFKKYLLSLNKWSLKSAFRKKEYYDKLKNYK